MKRFLIVAFISFNFLGFTQSEFVPGYYILKENAFYTIIQPGGNDFAFYEETECWYQKENLTMRANEVVIAYAKHKDRIFCFDPNGRMLVFSDASSLFKAPSGNVISIVETIEFMTGSSILEGSYMWAIGQNIAQETIKIQLGTGNTIEIPQKKVVFFDKIMEQYSKDYIDFSPVQTD
jgi:hypothetical protein